MGPVSATLIPFRPAEALVPARVSAHHGRAARWGRDRGIHLAAQHAMRSFAHGTSLENARSIQQMGLNSAAALAYSFGSHTPGAFFAQLLGLPSHPGPGLQMAYEWGKRHSDMLVVLIGQLPEEIFRALEAAGLVVIQPVPGAPDDYQVPPETVFYAALYPVVNQHVQW